MKLAGGIQQIYLIGFMGAGKTTAGRDLAPLLGWRFADLDESIRLREGKGIPEIFREGGETLFRQIESTVLASLARIPHLVVATGAGTYVGEENRRLIEAAGWSVWLQVSFAEARRRCGDGEGRPMFGTLRDVEALFAHRQPFYRCARTAVDTERIGAGRLAARILETILAEGFSPA